jgi:hypothetical protein
MDGKIKAAPVVARMWLVELEFLDPAASNLPALPLQSSIISTPHAPSSHSAAHGATCDGR